MVRTKKLVSPCEDVISKQSCAGPMFSKSIFVVANSPSFGNALFKKYDHINNCDFVIDTGSCFSLIPVSKFSPDNYEIGHLLAANNSNIDTFGTKLLTVDFLFDELLPHTFIVADIPIPIIGLDFLRAYQISINVFDSTWTRTVSPIGVTLPSLEKDLLMLHGQDISSHPLKIQKLLHRFHKVLDINSLKQLPKHNHKMKIELLTDVPVYSKPRRLPMAMQGPAEKIINELVDLNIMVPCISAYNSPAWLVKKPDGSYRLVGDFRKINSVSLQSQYPIPDVVTFFQKFKGKRYFSVVDLRHGFYSLPLDENCWKYTAISIGTDKQYCYTRAAMGLKSSSPAFQKFIMSVFAPLNDDFWAGFIDDIIIATYTIEEHFHTLSQMFQLMEDFGLVIKLSKCSFLQSEIVYLGQLISSRGVLPIKDRVAVIRDFPLPSNVAEVRRFAGLVAFNQKHIPRVAEIMDPIYGLLDGDKKKKSKKPVVWNDSARKAFSEIKQALINATELSHPKLGALMHLFTDSSEIAAGASLHQEIDGHMAPLGFFSRKFNSSQKKYSAFSRELMAAKWAIKHFEYYLKFQEFVLHVDNIGIVTAAKKKDITHLSPVDYRSLYFILENTMDIRHVKGSENSGADCLSRIRVNLVRNSDNTVFPQVTSVSLEEIADKQSPDFIERVKGLGRSLQVVGKKVPGSNKIVYVDISGPRYRPLVPDDLRFRVFSSVHSLAHTGFKRTLKLIQDRYVWISMRSDIKDLVAACVPCGLVKTFRITKAPLAKYPIATDRWGVIHMDCVGPLIECNHLGRSYKYLVTMICRFTKYLECIPTENIEAKTVISAFLSGFVSRYGPPMELITDRGSNFTSKLFEEMTLRLGITHNFCTAMHPSANGMIERQHRDIKNSLKSYLDRESWMEFLPFVLLGLRSAPNLFTNYSMSEQAFGFTPRLPCQFFNDDVDNNISEPTESQIEHLSAFLQSIPPGATKPQLPPSFVHPELSICNFVYVRRAKKQSLKPAYTGPHKVLKKFDKYFTLLLNNREDNVSIDRLKPATEYPFNLVPLNIDSLLSIGATDSSEAVVTGNVQEVEIEEEVDDILETSNSIRVGNELFSPIIQPVQLRTKSGRLIRVPRRFKDYVS